MALLLPISLIYPPLYHNNEAGNEGGPSTSSVLVFLIGIPRPAQTSLASSFQRQAERGEEAEAN